MAFDELGDQKDIELSWLTTTSTTNISEVNFTLYQNQPNPFRAETSIGFELPELTEATLRIYDVTGKMIYSLTRDFDKGYNEVSISNSDIGAVGLLYYELATANNTARRKMIILE